MFSRFTPTLIIGGGRVGAALAHNLIKAHFSLNAIVEVNKKRSQKLKEYFPTLSISESLIPEYLKEAKVIFICVQDDRIGKVAEAIAGLEIDLSDKLTAHTSGALTSNEIRPLKEKGALIGCLHPITAVPDLPPSEVSLSGIYFDIEGDPPAVEKLEEIVHLLGGFPIVISEQQKPAIHLAAVLYSNFFVILSHIARENLKKSHVNLKDYWQPFKPLVKATLANLDKLPPENALTGPLKRGDLETIRKHLELLQKYFPEVLVIYVAISQYALNLVQLPDQKKSDIIKLLKEYL